MDSYSICLLLLQRISMVDGTSYFDFAFDDRREPATMPSGCRIWTFSRTFDFAPP
jgi:hypothetical protein